MAEHKNDNPYPKVVHPHSAKASYVSPDLNLDKMRQEAQRKGDNCKALNKHMESLGGGPLKGEK